MTVRAQQLGVLDPRGHGARDRLPILIGTVDRHPDNRENRAHCQCASPLPARALWSAPGKNVMGVRMGRGRRGLLDDLVVLSWPLGRPSACQASAWLIQAFARTDAVSRLASISFAVCAMASQLSRLASRRKAHARRANRARRYHRFRPAGLRTADGRNAPPQDHPVGEGAPGGAVAPAVKRTKSPRG